MDDNRSRPLHCFAASRTPATMAEPGLDPAVVRELARLLTGLRFGSIEIVVHDGAVTQVERREKVRLPGVPARRI